MPLMAGKYKHYKNENIEEYFTAVGVPYFGRKMISMSSPVMEISVDGDVWTIRNLSMIRTLESKFKLGEEYEEHMPNNVIKSVTTQEGEELVTSSVIPSTGARAVRRYTFTDDECIVTLIHDKCTPGKRYFRRIKE